MLVKRGSDGSLSLEENTTYSANNSFSNGDQIGSSGWYVVYKGTGSSVNISGLLEERNYIVQVIEFNGASGSEKYNNNTANNNPKVFETSEYSAFENFESGDFTNFDWETSGGQDWLINSENQHEGSYCAKSGNITHSQSTTLEITMNISEDGNISFFRKVSSEGCCDGLSFYINDTLKDTWKGILDWQEFTYPITEGSQTFKWVYSKDGSVNTGLDSAFIDNIQFPTGTRLSIPEHSLSYTSESHGSLSGTANQTLTDGENGSAITAIPNTGYHFTQWSDGSTQNPRTDLDVGRDISVEAQYSINQYTLSYSANTNGSLSGSSSQTVNYEEDGSAVTAIPNTGYHFTQWSDGSTQNPRTDSNITANKTVTASFAINTYTVNYISGSYGSVVGYSTQTVNYNGSTIQILIIPSSGYKFIRWSDGSTQNPRIDTAIKSNLTVTAEYELIPPENATVITPTVTNPEEIEEQDNTIYWNPPLITVLNSNEDENTEEPTEEDSSESDNSENTENKNENQENDTSSNEEDSNSPEINNQGKYETKIFQDNGNKIIAQLLVKVEDQNGNPLSGIKVTLHSDPIIGYSNKNGIVTFNNVPEGEHSIEVSHNNNTYTEKVLISAPNIELTNEDKPLSVEMDILTVKVEQGPNYLRWILFTVVIITSIGVFITTIPKNNVSSK